MNAFLDTAALFPLFGLPLSLEDVTRLRVSRASAAAGEASACALTASLTPGMPSLKR